MKVYWSKCGYGNGNFGDKVTPMLLKHVGVPVEWAPPEHADLIGAGSILEKVRESFRGVVWTAGFMQETSRLHLSRARVLAVRGSMTFSRLECPRHDEVVQGDAGLLCGDLNNSHPRKARKLGIIPHFVDAGDRFVKMLADRSSEIAVIDICAEPAAVIRAVGECEHILSSSLHGLILADSLGIPSRWLELNHGVEPVTGGGFKYRDYYSVFGIDPVPMHLSESTTLDDALNAVNVAGVSRPGIEQIQVSLRDTLSRIKNTVRPASAADIAQKRDAEADWWRRRTALHRLIAELIPSGANVIVADGEQIRPSIVGVKTLPFVERQGQYWGPPGSAEEAIAEVERQVARGARWLVVAWPMVWMLEEFSQFAQHLSEKFTCLHESEAGRVFQAQQVVPPRNRRAQWPSVLGRSPAGPQRQ